MKHLSNAFFDRAWLAVFFLREYLFPFGCSLCGTDLLNANETWHGLCGACHTEIEQELKENAAMEACDYCGKPLISEHDRCLSCRNGESQSYDQVKVLFPYTGKYRKLLAAYKFGKNLAVGNYFAEKIIAMAEQFGFSSGVRIVPVPPRPGKIKTSGWDQVEYLAQALGRNSKAQAVSRCLKRLPSQSQKELSRENRRNNLRGRIIPAGEVPKIAIIIDDVMTTGSTLDACAAALKEAGTEKVYGICLFYD